MSHQRELGFHRLSDQLQEPKQKFSEKTMALQPPLSLVRVPEPSPAVSIHYIHTFVRTSNAEMCCGDNASVARVPHVCAHAGHTHASVKLY